MSDSPSIRFCTGRIAFFKYLLKHVLVQGQISYQIFEAVILIF